MDSTSLILVANPGSSSRKYALYTSTLEERARLSFEHDQTGSPTCQLSVKDSTETIPFNDSEVGQVAQSLETILRREALLDTSETIATIGIRVVAPSSYFLRDHVITDEVIDTLTSMRPLAPLHIDATIGEIQALQKHFPHSTLVGVSDSSFHASKPPYAWNYGINLQDADRYDIKRFGYHGISTSASIDALWNAGKLPPRVVVCHLGSGSSVSAVFNGRSIDTTMGYTPLEGIVMATRSGTVSPGAARALGQALDLNETELDTYLNTRGGLLGLGGSNDIRELIERESNGDHRAHLALTTLIHSIHKAIGEMLVALNGADLLVFTGTVGERSAYIRRRIVAHLEFTDFILDGNENDNCTSPERMTSISQATKSKPIIVIPTNESLEIARRVTKVMKQSSGTTA